VAGRPACIRIGTIIRKHSAAGAVTKAKDPVCGMSVDPVTARHSVVHDGREYFFCSKRCLEKFATEPLRYLTLSKPDAAPAPASATIYTCPMHPQIRQPGPGICPICGMALEPLAPTAESRPSHELADMTRRFWIGLVVSLPVVALEMGGHIAGMGTSWSPIQQLGSACAGDACGARCGLAVAHARVGSVVSRTSTCSP